MKDFQNRNLFFLIVSIVFIVNCVFVYQKRYKRIEDSHSTAPFTEVKIAEQHKDVGDTKLNEITHL